MNRYNQITVINFIKEYFGTDIVSLHAPTFRGNEKKYLLKCIDENFVSSVGKGIILFEERIKKFVGINHAIATVNGTSALHTALKVGKVNNGDEVITQGLTFVATCNAISYTGASPIFIDVDKKTMGMSPDALIEFLEKNTFKNLKGETINKNTNKKISACVPMHTFGYPCRIDEIIEICNKYSIQVIEDSAESLGSFYKNKHTGNFGLSGIFSFNGNKIITTGGGGMIVSKNKAYAESCRHITTTAKVKHKFEFIHDQIAFNYRMPNINAVLGLAQLESLETFINKKRSLAKSYHKLFENLGISIFKEPKNSRSNYWLNCIILNNAKEKNDFLEIANEKGVMARPIWTLMNNLKIYQKCQTDNLKNSKWLYDKVVCLPSGVA